MNETDLMRQIMMAISEAGGTVFRINVGVGRTPDGRYFSTGVPKGFSDLFGIMPGGKAFFIEVKYGKNKPSPAQLNFISRMRAKGCAAGVAYTVDEALAIIEEFWIRQRKADQKDGH